MVAQALFLVKLVHGLIFYHIPTYIEVNILIVFFSEIPDFTSKFPCYKSHECIEEQRKFTYIINNSLTYIITLTITILHI